MPALLYEYCRKGKHQPIKVGDGVAFSTDRQTQDYLLCEDCEDVLNRGGESWIADKLATWERSFPFFEGLVEQEAQFDVDGTQVYLAGQNPKIMSDKLARFALGIFWKASVHPWKKTQTEPRIDLGRSSDTIRRWLLGGVFPDDVCLTVTVSTPARAQILMIDPYEAVPQGWPTFFCSVPGILFMLSVDVPAGEAIRSLCLVHNPDRPINVSDQLTTQFERLMVSNYQRMRKTESLKRALRKIELERKSAT